MRNLLSTAATLAAALALQHLVAAALQVTRAMCPRLCRCDGATFAEGVRLAHLTVRGQRVLLLVMALHNCSC